MRNRDERAGLGKHAPALALPEFQRLLDEIGTLIPKIRDGYWWAHEVAYGTSGAGVGERGSRSAEDASWRTLAQLQQPDRARAAQGAAVACDRISEALEALSKAYGALDRAFPKARLELRVGYEQPIPRTVTKADLKDSEAAKTRREGRDEGWGRA